MSSVRSKRVLLKVGLGNFFNKTFCQAIYLKSKGVLQAKLSRGSGFDTRGPWFEPRQRQISIARFSISIVIIRKGKNKRRSGWERAGTIADLSK